MPLHVGDVQAERVARHVGHRKVRSSVRLHTHVSAQPPWMNSTVTLSADTRPVRGQFSSGHSAPHMSLAFVCLPFRCKNLGKVPFCLDQPCLYFWADASWERLTFRRSGWPLNPRVHSSKPIGRLSAGCFNLQPKFRLSSLSLTDTSPLVTDSACAVESLAESTGIAPCKLNSRCHRPLRCFRLPKDVGRG